MPVGTDIFRLGDPSGIECQLTQNEGNPGELIAATADEQPPTGALASLTTELRFT